MVIQRGYLDGWHCPHDPHCGAKWTCYRWQNIEREKLAEERRTKARVAEREEDDIARLMDETIVALQGAEEE